MNKINHGIKTPIALPTEYIDLGLPSGTLWATMNVGARSIVDYGDYFTNKKAMECDITLPTHEQFVELVENTTYKWDENYNNCGMNGGLFIGKNGNEVFFPASGYSLHESAYSLGSLGYYWSSTQYNKYNAYYLYFYSGNVFRHNTNGRNIGFPLRGVKNK